MKNLLLLLFMLFAFRVSANEKCNKVVFGELDWDSARFHVEVASFILKHGLECQVDKIPGSTIPLLTALGNGDIHIMMEIWNQNIKDIWSKFEKEGKVKNLGTNYPDAIQGWFVPTYMIKGDSSRNIIPITPKLFHVNQLNKYKKVFSDIENPSKGRFYNCILGWTCEDINTKKLLAYGLNKSFENFRPGTGAALSAVIASKYEKGLPFLAYYWGPTWVLGKYKLTMLKEPAFNEKKWKELVSGENKYAAVAYPVVKVTIGANSKWSLENPIAVNFLKKYKTTGAITSEALAFIQQKKGRTARDAAIYFLNTKKELWKHWLTEDQFKKVNDALKNYNIRDEIWKLDIGKFINDFIGSIVKNYGDIFRKASLPVLKFIIFVEKLLKFLPWWLFAVFVAVIGFYTSSYKLSLLILLSLGLIKSLGLWDMSMQTLALMIIATTLSTILGLPIGILIAKNNRLRSMTLPVLDAMQTMPSFVYLIPALMLFGLGKVPAVFATVIYAIVPTIRLTDLGIRKVDPYVVEAATSFGASELQLLVRVKLPLALPSIMAGINQSTMMALSMVVIASMIGARGLGEQVLLGIQKLDVGQGFTAGLAIVLLAIVIDRITQSIGKKLDKTL